jgi:hypothetical protein
MVTHNASFARDETPNNRRGEVSEGVPVPSAPTPPASFGSLNNDILVHILSSLSIEEMNNVAECSKHVAKPETTNRLIRR